MYRYEIELNILSLAPQHNDDTFLVGKKVLKQPNKEILKKDLYKCVKTLFPMLALPECSSFSQEREGFRQVITASVISYRQMTKELEISGIPSDFYTFTVKLIDE